MAELGRVPDVGDVVEVDGVALHVEAMEGRRVERVRARAVRDEPDGDGSGPRRSGSAARGPR
jgi:CBS domain containing-hemolysin-like protein